MLLCFSTGKWLARENDLVGVVMHMLGHHLPLLHYNSPTQLQSCPLGQRTNDFLPTSAKCCWGYSIAITFFHIQFRLGLVVTITWKICVEHNCVIFSTAILPSCLVGAQGVRKGVRMGSLQNFTSICDKLSFRDVVAGVTGAVNVGDIGDAMKGKNGKKNEEPPTADLIHVVKQKRKYVRKPKSSVCDGGVARILGECSNGGFQNLVGGLAPPSPKPKRRYQRRARGTPNFEFVPSTSPADTTSGSMPKLIGAPPTSPTSLSSGRERPRGRNSSTRRGHGPADIASDGTIQAGNIASVGTGPNHSKGWRCGRRRGRRSKDTSSEESPERVAVDPRSFEPPTTRARSHQTFSVQVLLRDLLWGGEVIHVPCPFAVGSVLGGDEANDGTQLWVVDFGASFGVQTLPRAACKEVVTVGPTPFSIVDGVQAQEAQDSLASTSAVPPNSDSSHDWDHTLSDLGSEALDFSSGASSCDLQVDNALALLGELGIYPEGPELERVELEEKYAEKNWHARTWSLLPRHPFGGKAPGASEHLPTHGLLQPIEYFTLFWDETLQRKIVRESNEYAEYVNPATGKRKGGEFTANSITLEEFRQFTGICCLVGVRDQPAIRDYWRRGHGALFCADVACTMSRWRFEYILRCLHMTSRLDFVTDKRSPHYDPIGKCRWILQHVESRFQHFWNLSPYITVDECMVAYNGRFCSFKQYLPAKPITHGIKIWAMACSLTSYVYRLEIYVGKENVQPDSGVAGTQIGMAGQVVTRLTKGLEGQWYTVTCDNFFTSPYLFDDLLSRGFYAVGTARKQRKGFPTSLGITHEQPRGTLHIRVHKDQKMAAIFWQDTKGVYFLATATDPMVPGGVVTSRVSGHKIADIPTSPIQIMYSQNMGGVDVGDQNRSYYSTQIATKKWWHRVFFFCLDSCIANAFTIHKEISKSLGEKSLTHKEFQLRVAYSLMGRPYNSRGGEKVVQPVRVVHTQPRGFLSHVPKKTNLRRVCCLCKRRTFWICPQCEGVRLCLAECFEFHHTRGTRL